MVRRENGELVFSVDRVSAREAKKFGRWIMVRILHNVQLWYIKWCLVPLNGTVKHG